MTDREYKIVLSGVLPPDDMNGWDNPALARMFDADRKQVRYALVAYNVHSGKEITETGDRILTVRLRGVEPVTDPAQADSVEQDMQTMFETRTGKVTLFGPPTDNDDDEPQPQDPTAGPWPGDPEWRQAQ